MAVEYVPLATKQGGPEDNEEPDGVAFKPSRSRRPGRTPPRMPSLTRPRLVLAFTLCALAVLAVTYISRDISEERVLEVAPFEELEGSADAGPTYGSHDTEADLDFGYGGDLDDVPDSAPNGGYADTDSSSPDDGDDDDDKTDPNSDLSSPPHPSENPYFFRGDVWEHNSAVSANLDRCAALGLLRETADPLPPLSPSEEAHRISLGCATNQTTVVILASLFFDEAFGGTFNAGEVVYAQSIIQTLNAYNYSYMFASLGWWNHDMRKASEIWRQHGRNVRTILADPEQVDLCWHDAGQRCLKTEDVPDGIPAWRLLGFWYWDDPGNPLGPSFTLSPSHLNANHFLSYSIEPTCRRLPYILPRHRAHPPQAYLLAKQANYLDDTPAFSWGVPALVDLQDQLGIVVAAGFVEDHAEATASYNAAGLLNYGKLDKMAFYEQVARSFVFLGVGRPRISPSPWDALCMGVPFINPILSWDENDPDNRTSWHPQQWRMTRLDPPYVYSVKAHDLPALTNAVRAALHHPIASWIPDYMRFDFVCERMAEVLTMDWKGKAEEILKERRRSGEGELYIL